MRRYFSKSKAIVIVIFLVLVATFLSVYFYYVDKKKNDIRLSDKIYVESVKYNSGDSLENIKDKKFKAKIEELKYHNTDKFVSLERQTFHISRIVDTNNDEVLDSHLMTNGEVEKYNNRNLVHNSGSGRECVVGNRVAEKYGLTLYLYVTQNDAGDYSCNASAEWNDISRRTERRKRPCFNVNDYIILTWSGDGNLIADEKYELDGSYSDGSPISFATNPVLNNREKGYVWMFNPALAKSYAKDIRANVILKRKNKELLGEKAQVGFVYVHNYDKKDDSLTVSFDKNWGKYIVERDNVKQWVAYCPVSGIEY